MGRSAQKKANNQGQKDSNSLFQAVEKSGLNPLKIAHMTSTIYKITDIAETLSMMLTTELRKANKKISFKDANDLKKLNLYARNLQKSASKDLMEAALADGVDVDQYAEEFGDSCDFMRESLEILSCIVDEEVRIKVISSLKILAK